MKEFLPLGSVITLKKGNKRIMICGRLQEREEDMKVFDYSAVYYPEGILDPNQLFLFNHDDIDRLYFVGMQDSEEFAFRDFLIEEAKDLS